MESAVDSVLDNGYSGGLDMSKEDLKQLTAPHDTILKANLGPHEKLYVMDVDDVLMVPFPNKRKEEKCSWTASIPASILIQGGKGARNESVAPQSHEVQRVYSFTGDPSSL
jgi:hypothetical protein